VERLSVSSRIHSSLSPEVLRWRLSRPGKGYVCAYALDASGRLCAFMLFGTTDYYNYHLGLCLSDGTEAFKPLFRLFRRKYSPATVAAWDFAMDEADRQLLKKMGMVSVPLINRFRKNPPALVRTLQRDGEGRPDWMFGGADIRKAAHWSLCKFDLDSF
jgi:hypothetical protein